MGKYNSSKYRVSLMIKEIEVDPNKLAQVLALTGCEEVFSEIKETRYGDNEKLLPPSSEYLVKLVEYIASMKQHTGYIDKGQKRLALFFENENREKTKEEAINLIKRDATNKKYNSKAWYVLEGETHPDVFIETDTFVLICEGKWIERKITTETGHLKADEGNYRSQMIRHIQGALNYTDKRIIALYLVDENCGYLHDVTKEGFEKQMNSESIALTDEEKAKYRSCFYGYLTWQQIEKSFGILFPTKQEIDQQKD